MTNISISNPRTVNETTSNPALMAELWLGGFLPDPFDQRVHIEVEPIEVPKAAKRLQASIKARSVRKTKKILLQKKANKLGKDAARLSAAGQHAKAKNMFRMRIELPHVLIRAN